MTVNAARRMPLDARLLLAGIALALVVAGQPAGGAPGEPVTGGASAVFHPGGFDNGVLRPSSPVDDYDGELLSVRTTYIGRDAGEPTIGVDAKGGAYMSAAAYDGPFGLPRTRFMRSLDGGATWQSIEPRIPGTDSPVAAVTLDPYLFVDDETGRVFAMDWHGDCSFLFLSDDQGRTWTTNPEACGIFVTDHPTLVAGNPPPALAPLLKVYPNVVYYCFNRVTDASCGRSFDGGLTWSPTGAPAFPGYEVGNPYKKFGVAGLCGGLHGHAVVDDDGRLYIPKSHCGLPTLAVSEDGGTTWRRTVVSTLFETGDAHVGEHHSVTVDAEGNVYYLFWDTQRHLPWLAISKDAGRTFGPPMMIAPPGVAEVNLPAMVAGDEGKLAVQFVGTPVANRDDSRRPWNVYLLVTENALAENPVFLSTTANPVDDPVHRGNCQGRCRGMLDFLDIVTSPADGAFWSAAVDNCTSLNRCRTSASGNPADAEGMAVRQVGGPRIRTVPPVRTT